MSPTFCRRDFRVSKSLAEFVACRRRSDQNDVLRRRAPGRLLLPLRGNSPSVRRRTYLSDCECANRPPAAIRGPRKAARLAGRGAVLTLVEFSACGKRNIVTGTATKCMKQAVILLSEKPGGIFRQSKKSRLFRRDFLFTSAAARQSARYWWPRPCGPDRRSTTGTGRWDR